MAGCELSAEKHDLLISAWGFLVFFGPVLRGGQGGNNGNTRHEKHILLARRNAGADIQFGTFFQHARKYEGAQMC